MFMVIFAGGMPFNGATIDEKKSLGGSESAAYYMAKELVRLGHRVTVFTSEQKTGSWEGVKYEWHGNVSEQTPFGDRFEAYMRCPVDVLIMQRHPAAFARAHLFNSKVNLWWLHDLALKRNEPVVNASLTFIDKVITVSEWHKRQVCETWNIDEDYVIASHNGVDYELFKKEALTYEEREPRSLLYSSRPERGLDNLIRPGGIMDQLPDHVLYVCGYDNTVPQMKSYYEGLWARCIQMPNVHLLGFLGKEELAERERKVMLHVYPTVFEDTSCIVALEAAGAGTPLIGSKWSAVEETARDTGAVLLKLNANGQVDIDKFVKTVRQVTSSKLEWTRLHEKALRKRQTWESAAKQWVEEIEGIFAKKTEDKNALMLHLLKHSDLMAARHLAISREDEISPEVMAVLDDTTAWVTHETMVADQNKAHHDYLYENPKFPWYDPNIKDSPRFRTLCQFFDKAPKNAAVYDIGPSEGAITLALAEKYPEMNFHGVDIEPRNVENFNKTAKERGITNAECHAVHSYNDLERADIVLLGEVLEHIPDTASFISWLYEGVKVGVQFICTTPYGLTDGAPDQSPKHVPVHCHHFERGDIFEMFGELDGFDMFLTPTKILHGIHNMGHIVYTWKKTEGKTPNAIDYERKLKQQAPRERVSLCMIIKNAEDSIGKALDKVAPFVDEVIIGIDPTTTDNTETRLEIKRMRYPHIQAFMLSASPLEQGFDEARNETIERASGSWILWQDDDESFEGGEFLCKYLRNNSYAGYLIPQHHFAAFPPALFKTDYPARLFRTGRGVSFVGVVHEHPYRSDDRDIGKAVVLPDVAYMHTGYATEDIRRGRFNRNFPLINKDRATHPNRALGKMLFIRDLSHLIRYAREAGGAHPQEAEMCTGIITMWKELLELGNPRMLIDSLQFYSHAVQVMGGGIRFAVAVDAARLNGEPRLGEDKVVMGEFVDDKDIKKLTEALLKDKLSSLTHRYF